MFVCLIQWVLLVCLCAVFLRGFYLSVCFLFPGHCPPALCQLSLICLLQWCTPVLPQQPSSPGRHQLITTRHIYATLIFSACWIVFLYSELFQKKSSILTYSHSAWWPLCLHRLTCLSACFFGNAKRANSSWLIPSSIPWTESTIFIFVFELNIVYLFKSCVCFLGFSAKPDMKSEIYVLW